MRRLRGLPGVLLLRSLLVVILVSILAALFLDRSDNLSDQVRDAANRLTITQINSALALRLLQAASTGDMTPLVRLERGNPFDLLAAQGGYVPPADYRGEIDGWNRPARPGWYFDRRSRAIGYYDGRRWRDRGWQLRLLYEDRDGNDRFDPRQERLHGLTMKMATD